MYAFFKFSEFKRSIGISQIVIWIHLVEYIIDTYSTEAKTYTINKNLI